MCIDRKFATAFAKSQLAAGVTLPQSGNVFISVKDSDKPAILAAARKIAGLGFTIVATSGTARYLTYAGIAVEEVNKVAQGRPHIVDRIKDGGIALIFNTTEGWQSLKDSQSIRASALNMKVPSFTKAAGSIAAAEAIAALRGSTLRSEESMYELKSLMRISYAVF